MSGDIGYRPFGEPSEITAAPRVIEALISSATDIGAAVADLVDNSIDAHATHVQIRIHTPASADLAGNKLGLSVWDNGIGMSAATLEEAVTLSSGEDTDPNRLGKYGVGLKAASFGKSTTTTIFSKAKEAETCGLELFGESGARRYRKIDESQAGSGFSRSFATPPEHGTIVRWEQLRGIERFTSNDELRKWVERTSRNLATHLGLVFHLFLSDASKRLRIEIIEVDAQGGTGIPMPVRAVSAIPTDKAQEANIYQLTTQVDGVEIPITFYIAPRGTRDEQLQSTTNIENGMGLYVERNKRLIRLGGWDGLIAQGTRKLQLARIQVTMPSEMEERKHLEVKHDKSGCQFSTTLRDALIEARTIDGSKNLSALLRMAESESKNRKARLVHPPNLVLMQGEIVSALEQRIRDHCTISGIPIRVQFQPFERNSTEVFHLDLNSRVLGLNSIHSKMEESAVDWLATCLAIGLHRYLLKTTLSDQDLEDLKGWNALLWNALEGKNA